MRWSSAFFEFFSNCFCLFDLHQSPLKSRDNYRAFAFPQKIDLSKEINSPENL